MRRVDPKGDPLSADCYVFGNTLGQKVDGTKRAWLTGGAGTHGHKPVYTDTMNLDEATAAALDAIDLHFHDLRREAGSRWLEGGVPLHVGARLARPYERQRRHRPIWARRSRRSTMRWRRSMRTGRLCNEVQRMS